MGIAWVRSSPDGACLPLPLQRPYSRLRGRCWGTCFNISRHTAPYIYAHNIRSYAAPHNWSAAEIKAARQSVGRHPQQVGMPTNPVEWGIDVAQLWKFAAETVFKTDPAKYMRTFPDDEPSMSGDSATDRPMKEVCLRELIDVLGGFDCPPPANPLNMYKLIGDLVKPMTKDYGVGLANFLNMNSSKSATVFVSHAWAERFALLVLCLCLGCCDSKGLSLHVGVDRTKLLETNAVLWICALSINQNQDVKETLGADVMQSPFAVVLHQCSDIRVVYNSDVNIYDRVWCCFEMYLCQQKANKDKSFCINTLGVPDAQLVAKVMEHIDTTGLNDTILAEVCKIKEDTDTVWKFEEVAEAHFEATVVKEFYAARPECRCDVSNATASVDQDREDIMNVIGDKVDSVNILVNKELSKKLAQRLVGIFHAKWCDAQY